ncbi:MAG TPA: tRNA (adenosine(37)-N6)-dimethylallyltransferase MiaA [Candidatus Paceibacterota bacterium]
MNSLKDFRKKLKKNLSKPKIVAILGPTSSGKSDLSVNLAKKFDGEIISADSRQVYKGLDIGSGKVPLDRKLPSGYSLVANYYYKGVPHHLLDIASPKKTFTVAEYKKLGKQTIEDTLKRGNLPIITGGTGLYIDALIYDMDFPKVPPDYKLREELEEKNTEELFKILKGLDKKRAESVDPNNRRRLVRAIEIIKSTGEPISVIKRESPYDVLKIGIKISREELKNRIQKRLDKRLKLGMIDEVEDLHNKGLSWRRLDDLGLEYRFISRHLRGIINYEEMRESILRESYKYAKRQMTWWRKDKGINWIENPEEVDRLVKDFIK